MLWGIWGIVQIANSNDFVLMITAGTVIGEHEFDEGFTEDGLLRWQSQPKNTLKTEIVEIRKTLEILVNKIT